MGLVVMSTIELVYEFAQELHYQVSWIEPGRSFRDRIDVAPHTVDLTVRQDGWRMICSSRIEHLSDVAADRLPDVMRKALELNAGSSPWIYYAVNADALTANVAFDITDDIDSTTQYYLQARHQLFEAVTKRLVLAAG